ncbi:MAG TPA: Gfo/Idh/MocA family oxidoreductase [Anaerolineales bacterium]|nr:Gfo/Idh/MocA family oxidoreductase [Anaerolineales bacterium]
MTTRWKLGIVGCGRVVERFHLPAIRARRDWEIVAVADPSPERRSWAAGQIPGAKVMGSLHQILAAAPLDAVLIAAPPLHHRDLCLGALAAGVHVLVEKPCATTRKDALAMAAAASRAGRLLRVSYNRRFHPSYVALKQRMAGAAASETWTMDFRLSFTVVDWDSFGGHLGRIEGGGGVLLDAAVHQLDTLAWMRGSPVARVRTTSYDRGTPGTEEVRYAATLADGTEARCLARHGVGYTEMLEARAEDRVLFASPTAFLEGLARDSAWYRHAASRRAWVDRKLTRFRLKPDPMLVSFIRQWEAFAAALDGRPTSEALADGLDAVAVHTLIDDLRAEIGPRKAFPAVGSRGPSPLRRQPASTRRRKGAASAEPPEASIILVVGNQRARAARALESILHQDGIDRAEVLLVDLGRPGHPPLPGSEQPLVRVLGGEGLRSYGPARAEAVGRARGEFVVFMEEHCLAQPGWLRSLVSRLSDGPWAGVGPRVVSANPGVGFSDAMEMIEYGRWVTKRSPRETEMLPGNNSAYRRQDLLDLGPELESLFLADTVLQWRLMDEGKRLFEEPGAVIAHRHPVTLWSAVRGEFLYHIGFAGARAESFGWPWPVRLGYAAASVIIPWLRLSRMLRATEDDRTATRLRRSLPGVLLLLYSSVLGQAVGAVWGSGSLALRFTDYELNEPRPLRGERLASR